MKYSWDYILIITIILSMSLSGVVFASNRLNNGLLVPEKSHVIREMVLNVTSANTANDEAKSEELAGLQFHLSSAQIARSVWENLFTLLLYGMIMGVSLTLFHSNYYRYCILRRNSVSLSASNILSFIMRQDGMK